MRQQTFARAAAGPRPTASEVLRPFIPPRSPSGRRLARHPSSNDDGAANTCESASEEPCLPRRPACLLVLHCSRPSRPLKPPNCLGGWRPGSTPKMPHSHIAHEAKGPFCMRARGDTRGVFELYWLSLVWGGRVCNGRQYGRMPRTWIGRHSVLGRRNMNSPHRSPGN